MGNENILQTTNLTKVYRKLKKTVLALDSLSLELRPGEIFGFLGPNGAGKSTTIKILTGQIRPTSGEAKVLGFSAGEVEGRWQMGYLPENPSFYDFLTGREYLRFVARCFGADTGKAVDFVLEKVDLAAAADRPMRTYSKGMVQRLGIAQTLVHDPELYILDEPMSGLDPMGRALVKDIIKDLKRRGKSVFFSTHITADVEVVCDRLGVIVGGKLRALDSVANILQSGIEGYTVQAVNKDGTVIEKTVDKERLQEEMEQLWSQGNRVERIEPKRQDLEAFFLDVVAKAGKESLAESGE